MNRIIRFSLFIFFILISSGCGMTMRTNTQVPSIAIKEINEMSFKNDVSLRNVATNKGEEQIGKWIGWKVIGDLYKYTESAIGAAKNSLEEQGIEVNDNADKVLELAVFDALSEQGMVKFRLTTKLRVKTGDGLEKEFTGIHNYANGYGTTFATERALAQCVVHMLNDADIRRYLAK